MKGHKVWGIPVLILTAWISGQNLNAQTTHSYFWESEFEISFQSDSLWSHSFGIENRGLFSELQDGEEITGAQNEHFQLEHFTGYQFNSKSTFSLGLRYRFREVFNESNYDEIRLMQQLEYSTSGEILEWMHEVRLEQRFRVVETIHRLRYEIGAGKALNNDFSLQAFTQALYAVSPQSRPEAEQRFTLQIENNSFTDLEIEFGIEYRMADYFYNTGHEFFLFTGVSLNI